jgi:hypothetical protein
MTLWASLSPDARGEQPMELEVRIRGAKLVDGLLGT